MSWPTENVLALATSSATFDPPNIVALTQATTTINCPGAALGDFAIASFSANLAGVMLNAYVSSADTVTVIFFNGTASDVNMISGTLRVKVIKQ